MDFVRIRRELHRYPELSGQEKETAQRIVNWLEGFEPREIRTGIGGYGVAAIYDSGKEGPSVLLRCDLDALPIEDRISQDHASGKQGVGHKCGHDGHMTMMLMLAQHLQQHPPQKGKVVLLFQPAEEDAAGAIAVLQDPQWKDMHFDFSFAIHNLPGKPMGTVVIRKGVMNAASEGLIITLRGLHSHAGEPEKGINPAFGLSKMVLTIPEILRDIPFRDKVWSTVIHTRVGERAFGTSPGEGVLMLTLRAYLDEDLTLLKKETEKRLSQIAAEERLEIEFSYTDIFPAVQNEGEAVEIVKSAARKTDLDVEEKMEPYRVSEDFAWFTQKNPSALLWMGSGLEQPNLHHPAYDFPDELLETGRDLWIAILREQGIGIRD